MLIQQQLAAKCLLPRAHCSVLKQCKDIDGIDVEEPGTGVAPGEG